MNDELKKLVDFGADIMFVCRGIGYTILAGADEGIIIGIQNDDDNDGCFETYEDMVDNYLIDGKKMRDVLDDIRITFTSGAL